MRSPWGAAHQGDDHHSPVEMRFVDMFMTALGALVFIAMLLVFLLPKWQGNLKEIIEDNVRLKQANSELQDGGKELRAKFNSLQNQLDGRSGPPGTENKNIVKRWFGVLLVSSGCRAREPELYARWEGTLINFETEQPVPDAKLFDAGNVTYKTTLMGQRYFDIGTGPTAPLMSPRILKEMDTTGNKALNKEGLQIKLFYAVSRGSGSYSIYTGLRDPRAQADTPCVISPSYLSSQGLIPGDEIEMTQRHPYAWLRQFYIYDDGSTTFGTPPAADEAFRRDLEKFSLEQSRSLCEKTYLCGTSDAHYASLAGPEPTRRPKPGESFRDCPACPDMVVVPATSFVMGSPRNELQRATNESPQHKVTFASPFAVGRSPVTFDEWNACVADGGCNGYVPPDEGWGRSRMPVINISWNDAKAYATWLSHKTGKSYRLLSEAEREYVTRAGTSSPFWWGTSISPRQANYDLSATYGGGPRGTPRHKTVRVDFFPHNNWGLYQVHGNTWEWVEDCYRDGYDDSPSDGSALIIPGCNERVLRGGDWHNNPKYLRAASRENFDPNGRTNRIGMRVARTLP